MAGIFGGSRHFGGELGHSPMQRLAGGIGLGFGGQRFPQVITNELLGGRGPTSMFGGGGGGMFGQGGNQPSPAALLNSQNLDKASDRQFSGYQMGEDRELTRLLQMRELANKLGLANVDQQTQFGVQDRRNSGALDQINTQGGWDQSMQSDRLGSAERMGGQQRELEMAIAQGGWNQQGLDRGSREKLTGMELQNALEKQAMVNTGALDQIGAKGNVDMGLTDLEGRQKMDLQQLMNAGQLQNTGLQGQYDLQGRRIDNEGNAYVAGLGLQGDKYVADRNYAGLTESEKMRQAGETTRTQAGYAHTEKGWLHNDAREQRSNIYNRETQAQADAAAFARTQDTNKTTIEGYKTDEAISAADRLQRATEAQEKRTFDAAESVKRYEVEYGPVQHREKILSLTTETAKSEADMASAKAATAQAESEVARNPDFGKAKLAEAMAASQEAQNRAKEIQIRIDQLPTQEKETLAKIRLIELQQKELTDPGGSAMREMANPAARAAAGYTNEQAVPSLLAQGKVDDPAVIAFLRKELDGAMDYANPITGGPSVLDASWGPTSGSQEAKRGVILGMLQSQGLNQKVSPEMIDQLLKRLEYGYGSASMGIDMANDVGGL